MKKVFLFFIILITLIVAVFAMNPDKTIQASTKQFAQENDLSPFMANFIVHAKVGRKAAYLVMRKKIKKYLKESDRS